MDVPGWKIGLGSTTSCSLCIAGARGRPAAGIGLQEWHDQPHRLQAWQQSDVRERLPHALPERLRQYDQNDWTQRASTAFDDVRAIGECVTGDCGPARASVPTSASVLHRQTDRQAGCGRRRATDTTPVLRNERMPGWRTSASYGSISSMV